MEGRSCWGCGDDYLGRWKDTDLAPHPTEEEFWICPDCYEEIGGVEE